MAEKNRGALFEDQLERSIPPEVYVRKLHTPPPPAARMGPVVGLLKRLAKGEDVDWAVGILTRTRFTPKSPYDYLFLAPAHRASIDVGDRAAPPPWDLAPAGRAALPLIPKHEGHGLGGLLAQPSIAFAVEAKSTAGKSLSLSRIEDHQIEGLVLAASRGYVAGFMIEFPEINPEGEVWFLPIGAFVEWRRGANRASIPASDCARLGVYIPVDRGRGRVHRYWRMGDFFRGFGAAIPADARELLPAAGAANGPHLPVRGATARLDLDSDRGRPGRRPGP